MQAVTRITSEDIFKRTEALIGRDALVTLAQAKVALLGVGGVGSYTAEALVRAGIGAITLIDNDNITADNINRQLEALVTTVGAVKIEIVAERLRSINPAVQVLCIRKFFTPANSAEFDLAHFDYVADAIDTVAAKVELARCCTELGVPLISCMGTGNKLDPTAFKVADIYATAVCPLCKIMRRELRKHGISELKVVYSEEKPGMRNRTPASISFVPSVAGLIMAGEIVKALTAVHRK